MSCFADLYLKECQYAICVVKTTGHHSAQPSCGYFCIYLTNFNGSHLSEFKCISLSLLDTLFFCWSSRAAYKLAVKAEHFQFIYSVMTDFSFILTCLNQIR